MLMILYHSSPDFRISCFRSCAGFLNERLLHTNLETSLDHVGSISRMTCLSSKENAAYLALKTLNSPFERERTQSVCFRQSGEQYRLPGFILSVPQERHIFFLPFLAIVFVVFSFSITPFSLVRRQNCL